LLYSGAVFSTWRAKGIKNNTHTPSSSLVSTNNEWKNNPNLYPVFPEIARALQNEGTEREATGKKDKEAGKIVRRSADLTNLAKNIYCDKYKGVDGIDTNINRERMPF
jgi:hypothetical protein